jgi:hypothetical protein
MISPKQHQLSARRFDAFPLIKIALPFSFDKLFLIYLGSFFHYLKLIMSVSRTKLMLSCGKGSNVV